MNKYWNGAGKYQVENEFIMNNFVPEIGEVHSENIELVRLVNKYIYDMYNNGLCNFDIFYELFSKMISIIEKSDIQLTVAAFNHIEFLKKAIFEYEKGMLLSNYVDYSEEEMSDREEFFEYKFPTFIEKLIYDIQGTEEFFDCIIEFVLNTKDLKGKVNV